MKLRTGVNREVVAAAANSGTTRVTSESEERRKGDSGKKIAVKIKTFCWPTFNGPSGRAYELLMLSFGYDKKVPTGAGQLVADGWS